MSDSLEPFDEERLAAEVARVLEEVPFYSGYRGALAEFEVLRRDDLLGVPPVQWVRRGVDLAAELTRGTIRPVTTSGSTDEPLKVYADLSISLPPTVWSMHGLEEPLRLANLTSPVCLGNSCPGDVARLDERVLLLTFGMGLFEASDAAITRVAKAFNEFAPDIAFVNPVWLHWLALRATRLGLTLHQPKLIALTYQYPSRCQRRGLARAFPNVPQVEFYGASEFGGTDLAIGCPSGHLHVVNYQAFVEVLPSVHEGHDELVFSTPTSRTMPLLRYAPGDLGRLTWLDDDACELADVPVLELDGRVSDAMHVGGRVVTTRAFDDALGDVEGLLFYEARARGDVLGVRLISEPGAERQVELTVREALRHFGRLELTFVERFALGPSGKLKLTGDDERNALDVR